MIDKQQQKFILNGEKYQYYRVFDSITLLFRCFLKWNDLFVVRNTSEFKQNGRTVQERFVAE